METPQTTSLFDLLAQGGWAMWPLGLLTFAMLLLCLLTWQLTRSRLFCPLGPWDGSTAPGSTTTAARCLTAVLDFRQIQQKPNPQTWETVFSEQLDKETASIGQGIQYLNVIASVAPMVGLLGTVSGMISAFSTIATGGMGKPELLAGDIGEALITTASGLVVGIPAMVAFFYLRNRLHYQVLRVQEYGRTAIAVLENITVPAQPVQESDSSAHSPETSRSPDSPAMK